jgi:hypothetical protein
MIDWQLKDPLLLEGNLHSQARVWL